MDTTTPLIVRKYFGITLVAHNAAANENASIREVLWPRIGTAIGRNIPLWLRLETAIGNRNASFRGRSES
jgi:hypothetical protein